MIHLVTLNPALDLTLQLAEPSKGKIGEVLDSQMEPGGKALNIARFLKKWALPALTWLGPGDGNHPTHVLYRNLLNDENLKARFLGDKAPIRMNVVLAKGYKTKKYNHSGYEPQGLSLSRLNKTVKPGDLFALTGRLPKSLKPVLFGTWVKELKKKGVRVVLDTSGAALFEGLKAKPWFFKVNLHELSEALGQKIPNLGSAPALSRNILVRMGITHGAVTDGANGAVVWEGREAYWVRYSGHAVKQFVVGAGDGFLAGYLKGFHIKNGLKDRAVLACAAATAVAQSGIMGFTPKLALKLMKSVTVKRC